MRLAVWTGSLAFGIAVAVVGEPRPLALVALGVGVLAVLAAAALGLAGRPGRTVGGAALGFGLGVGLGLAAARPRPLAPAVADAARKDDASSVDALVARGPEWAGRGARLVLELARVDGRAASGVLALSVIAGWPDFGPGERVRFRAALHEPHGTRNPGLPDPALALRAAGIDVLAGVPSPASLERLDDGAPTGGLRRAAFRARRALRAAVDATAPGPAGAFLKTAVLGDRRGVGDDVEAGFAAAGATHVLSVSGLHLAAVAAVVFVAARVAVGFVPSLALYVDPRVVAAALALPAIVFFTLLTGEAVATQRSAIMLSVGMGGILVGRPVSAAPAIAAAAAVILAPAPLRLFDQSLQLSLASVIGIALLAERLGPARRRRGDDWRRRAVGWLWRFGAATIAATAFTTPLVAHDFGEIAPAGPLGNLALVPLVELGVVPLGLLGAALAAAGAEAPGHLVLRAAAGAARLALAIAEAFRAHAPLLTCRLPNALETAALTAAAAAALLGVRARGWPRRWALVTAGVAVATGAGSLAARDWARRHDPALRVTFLDVGQGDAAVVEAPGGAVALVDGGGTFDDAFDPGERIVEPFLRARGITRVDLVALSHPHPDHLNGLRRVLARFPVGALWTSGDGRNPEHARLLELAHARGVPAPVPASRALGASWLEPLGPFVVDAGGEAVGPPPGLTVNDASLVLRLAFAGRAVLFPGDLEADGEGELVGRRALGQAVDADVLKVPHHGSRTSSSDELVDAVHPALAVISLGWRNRFHFPAPEVLARYAARGAAVLRTDRDGAVTVRIAPDGAMSATRERGEAP